MDKKRKKKSSINKKYPATRRRPWHILLPSIDKPRTVISAPLVIVYGFLALIILGTILLVLPISSKSGQATAVVDALFTATSAVCVTGLIVVDTGSYWSSFGQGVILALIQIGGFGFMSSATLLLLIFRQRIGLQEKVLISESMGLTQLGGLVSIIKKMAVFTLLAEVTGAIIFYIRFSVDNSSGTAIWKSIFHSVSAFNNAGFDIFGNFRSLMDYQGDALVILVTAILIILGGISFFVVSDVIKARSFNKLTLDSKLVLTATALLLTLGTLIILNAEFSVPDTMGPLSVTQKLVNAFFQSVTARTAGFSTISMASVTDYSLFFIMILMFIGGAAGSTAGGIKVNTFAMLSTTIWSIIRGKVQPGAFGREFSTQQILRALTVIMLAILLVVIVVFLLTVTEEFRFINLLFEAVSAFGTVGLSTGITPLLSTGGRLIITATMFAGRLGPLTLILALIQGQKPAGYRHPEEIVRIG